MDPKLIMEYTITVLYSSDMYSMHLAMLLVVGTDQANRTSLCC